MSHFLGIFQNHKFKDRQFVPWRQIADLKMRRVRHGPVIVAAETVSVPVVAHSPLCLQMSSLTVIKTLGAHARIQAVRRLRARFLNERTGSGLLSLFSIFCTCEIKKACIYEYIHLIPE